jgi:8-oxo-dGTP pyrophosphatase MutT (NUDIX family)
MDHRVTVPARPAATVALVRDGAQGLEVLMMVRPMAAEFAPRALVFPGGRIDDADGDPGWMQVFELDAAAQARIAEDGQDEGQPGALAFRVGAIREMFEETAIVIGSAIPPDPEWAESARGRVHNGEVSFLAMVREAGLRLRPAELVYFARWVTPESQPKRYDTRFYAAGVPGGQTPSAAPGEVESVTWISPQEALANADDAEAYVMPPTRAALEKLARFGDVAAAVPGMYELRDTRPVLPRIVRTGADGKAGPDIQVVLPGDPGYEAAEAL